MKKFIEILLIEDSQTDAHSVQRTLDRNMKHNFSLQHVTCMAEAEEALAANKSIDVILLDLGLPDTVDGQDTFNRLKNIKNKIPVIILSIAHNHDMSVQLIAQGAEAYVRKSSVTLDPHVLCETIDFSVCRHEKLIQKHKRNEEILSEKNMLIQYLGGGYSVYATDRLAGNTDK